MFHFLISHHFKWMSFIVTQVIGFCSGLVPPAHSSPCNPRTTPSLALWTESPILEMVSVVGIVCLEDSPSVLDILLCNFIFVLHGGLNSSQVLDVLTVHKQNTLKGSKIIKILCCILSCLLLFLLKILQPLSPQNFEMTWVNWGCSCCCWCCCGVWTGACYLLDFSVFLFIGPDYFSAIFRAPVSSE